MVHFGKTHLKVLLSDLLCFYTSWVPILTKLNSQMPKILWAIIAYGLIILRDSLLSNIHRIWLPLQDSS